MSRERTDSRESKEIRAIIICCGASAWTIRKPECTCSRGDSPLPSTPRAREVRARDFGPVGWNEEWGVERKPPLFRERCCISGLSSTCTGVTRAACIHATLCEISGGKRHPGVFTSSHDTPTWRTHDDAHSNALLPQIRDSFWNFDKAVEPDTGIHGPAPPRNSFYHFHPSGKSQGWLHGVLRI